MTNTNPILKGFNPDPSIIRVGKDYYIATSTFEWFPGVQIHHSTDLVHWTLMAHPLSDTTKLDIKGVPDSCGVWAPCLSYHSGTYYLVYSAVRSFDGMYKDTPNYLITATDIRGPWSDPVFLSSAGFDGSLFHDADGKKYYLSMRVDHRRGKFFGGIVLQEYDETTQSLIGEQRLIYHGTALGLTEGPHLYQRDGYYYLITAEGGTEYGHAVSLARSTDIRGPYEDHPDNPLISTRDDDNHPLQKCGHGDLVWTEDNDCYIVYLVGRPLSVHGRCTLGRETAIERLEWREDNWCHLSHAPRINIPELPQRSPEKIQGSIDFASQKLSINYQSLRIPIDNSWVQYPEDDDYLRLVGREGLSSTFEQSLLARRVQHFNIEYSISLDISPQSFLHMAGLVCYYNTGHYFYLNVSTDDSSLRVINLIRNDNFNYEELTDPVPISDHGAVHLKVRWQGADIQFYYKDNDDWTAIGEVYDASILSDDYVREGSDRYRPAFTGSFVGFCCQDLAGNKSHADFYSCEYKEL